MTVASAESSEEDSYAAHERQAMRSLPRRADVAVERAAGMAAFASRQPYDHYVPRKTNGFQWAVLAGLLLFFAVVGFAERWAIVAFASIFVLTFAACTLWNYRADRLEWSAQRRRFEQLRDEPPEAVEAWPGDSST